MTNNDPNDRIPERRSEKRRTAQRYYSVQFPAPGLDYVYQFKLWNISTKGMCILVKEDSVILKQLEVDQIIRMTYYLAGTQGANEVLKTQIKHITRHENGRFKGHYLIGLVILE